MSTVGVIGLGVMGKPIARHLIEAGLSVVGYDIERQALEILRQMGGVAVTSAQDVAEYADVILTLLPSAAALRDVVGGLCADGPSGDRRRRMQHAPHPRQSRGTGPACAR